MSWHERAAYMFGFAVGLTVCTIRPWWLTGIVLLILSALGAAVSTYLDKKEPFADKLEAMR
jgi:disulfide bond formation protein DsbB